MKNIYALAFVVVFLFGCSAYSYTHTSRIYTTPDYGSETWRELNGIPDR